MNDGGGLVGIVLLIALVLVVMLVSTQPSWLAGNVRTTYAECMAAAATPADQKLCDPAAPTPTPR
jgi:hypothetical protein